MIPGTIIRINTRTIATRKMGQKIESSGMVSASGSMGFGRLRVYRIAAAADLSSHAGDSKASGDEPQTSDDDSQPSGDDAQNAGDDSQLLGMTPRVLAMTPSFWG